MTKQLVQTLPGMRDLSGDSARRMESTASRLRGFLGAHGYDTVVTPIIEDANLFIRKSGGELVSRLYAFTDPGGRTVCLRPEFTPAVIRHYLAGGAGGAGGAGDKTPARFQYWGPVFRYDGAAGPQHNQITQLGAELIGQNGRDPDTEVIWLAWSGLQELRLPDVRLWIGSVGLLFELLDGFDLSESARAFAAGSVNELKSGAAGVDGLVARARETGLVRTGPASHVEEALKRAGEDAAKDILHGMADEGVTGPTGRRSSEQIAARLLRKAKEANDPAELTAALRLIDSIVRLNGPPRTVLTEARSVLDANGIEAGALEHLHKLIDALIERGVDENCFLLDLGLARGMAYYTGVVFELGPAGECGAFGGGGRYDGLVRALGGEGDTPAMGFSYELDRVVAAVGSGAGAA